MAWDYIIVGAGSAGCVLANRLSADPGTRVLLVEAGSRDRHPLIHIPAGLTRLLDHPRLTWRYRTAPDPASGNRAIPFPAGRGLGGSSSINGLLHIRGQPEDYDQWAQAGCRGWSYSDILPYFIRSERWQGAAAEGRGLEGPLTVSALADRPPLCEEIIAAGRELGLEPLEDMSSGAREGIGYYQQTRRGRFRASAARAYLAPALKRPNLRVLTGAQVRRLVLEARRAIGVELQRGGETTIERAAGEVIVAAGVIGSPALLQRSGIGDPGHLRPLGIEMRHELKGVGLNLQDHYVVRITSKMKDVRTLNETAQGIRLMGEILKYGLKGTGALTYSAALIGAFARLQPGSATPDLQYVIAPGSFEQGRLGKLDAFPGMTIGCWQMRPHSRGHVRIVSPAPDDPPEIKPRYLAEGHDQDAVVRGLRFARQLYASRALAPFVVAEVVPGAEVASDAQLLDYARTNGSTVYHGAGTCRMGIDPGAVVDPELRVLGIERLRVIDASVMPSVTSTNTNATTIMIAEKAADLLRA